MNGNAHGTETTGRTGACAIAIRQLALGWIASVITTSRGGGWSGYAPILCDDELESRE